jgi:uncharacterized protein YjcR
MALMRALTCPPDFKDFAPSRNNRQLAEKYGVGEKTITRWRRENGMHGSHSAFRQCRVTEAAGAGD